MIRSALAPRPALLATLAVMVASSIARADGDVARSLFEYDFAARPWVNVKGDFADADGWQPERWRNRAFVGNTRGSGATLARAIDAPKAAPITVVTSYMWKAGRGAAAAAIVLTDGAAAIELRVAQGAGDSKYKIVYRDAHGERELGAVASDAVDLGNTAGGRLPPAGVTFTYDPKGSASVERDGGPSRAFDAPPNLAPSRVEFRDDSPKGEGLRLVTLRAFAGAYDPRVDFRGLALPWGNTFVEGTDPRAALAFRWPEGGPASRPADVDLSIVDDESGATVARVRASGTVGSGGALAPDDAGWSRSLAPGLYRARGVARVGPTTLPVDQRFAVASAELSARPFEQIPAWVGINPYLAPFFADDDYDAAFDFMRTLGVRHLRWLVGWGRIQPTEGEYDWSLDDRFMSLAARHDMGVMIGLSYFGANWANAKVTKMAWHDDGRALWIDAYARPVMNRYRGQVKFWQIWNEPDAFWNDDPEKATGFAKGFGTPANYYDLLRRAIEAGREIDPSIKVMLSLASGRHEPGIRRMVGLGLGSPGVPFEAINAHAYGATLRHLTNVRRILDELGHGDVPIGSGEVGLPDRGDRASQRAQANRLAEVMLGVATVPNVYGVDWFVLGDASVQNYGILDRKVEPKPAVLAYHTISHLLSGASAVGKTEVASGVRTFTIPRDGRPPLVALMSVDGGARQVRLTRGGGGGEIVAWDLRGRRRSLAFEGGRETVDLARDLVLIEGDVRVEPTLDVALRPQPDGRLDVVIDGKLPATVRAEVTVDAGPLGAVAPKAVDAGSGRAVATFALPAAKPGERYPITARVTWPDGGAARAGRDVEFTTAPRVTDAEARQPRRPDGVPALTVDAFEPLVPGTFHGPADASATVGFAWTDAHLVLWIDQVDDVFSPVDADHPWTDDGPQLAIDPQFERRAGAPGAEIAFGIGKDGRPVAFNAGEPRFEPDLVASRDESTKHTYYRLMVPWQELGVTPAAGRNIGLSLIVNDNDDGRRREGWLAWGGGIGHDKDPAKYREIVLGGAGRPE